MTIDLRTVILGYNGNPVQFKRDEGANVEIVDLTVREAMIQALNNLADTGDQFSPQEVLSPASKMKIYGLSVKIYQSQDMVDLSSDDIDFLKERIGKIWNAIVIGRMTELFDSGKQKDYSAVSDAENASSN